MQNRRNRIFHGADDSLVAYARLACIDRAGRPAPGIHIELKAECKTQHNTNTQHNTTRRSRVLDKLALSRGVLWLVVSAVAGGAL